VKTWVIESVRSGVRWLALTETSSAVGAEP
jgi:hypothetical protein